MEPGSSLLRRLGQAVLVGAVVVLAPLAGAWLAGNAPSDYLRFPPRPTNAVAASFSWPLFVAGCAGVALVLTPFLARLLTTSSRARAGPPAASFPGWGWLGLAVMIGAWLVAWGAGSTPEYLRRLAFTPLWLGYIVLVNAVTRRRTGRCLMTERPLAFLALFPTSAVFWWVFEYLNQFVGNWVYTGDEPFSSWGYFWAATVPFSTVLPAVLSTRDLLASVPALHRGLGDWWRLPMPPARTKAAAAILAAAAAALVLLGAVPALLFPALWLAPLAVTVAVRILAGDDHLLHGPLRGDWRAIWLAALAALACGFLWEFWNWQSLSRWDYHIPYVSRFQLFEMPLLGYAGYLPFGLECVIVARLLVGLPGDPFRHEA